MTWLKLSDDFSDDCARAGLSDAAYRTHVEGLGWTMRRETNGSIDRRDLRRFAETENPAAAVAELLAVGFWAQAGDDSWRIVHHMEHQPEPEVLGARRRMTAERQRRFRRRRANVPEQDPSDGVTRRVTGTGRVGTGRV
jgi:hypothetical protein